MKTFLIGLAVGICLCLAAEFLFLTRGGMPVATKGGPMPFERFVAQEALRSAIGREAGRQPPIQADERNLLAGASIYREQCSECHGTWGHAPSATALGMSPAPPQLLPPKKGVTDDPVGETFWKARNGIRLTGMPGYAGTLSDTEIWQVSLVLFHAHELPPRVEEELRR